MLRIAAVLMIAAAPALAETASGSLGAGIVITGAVPRTPAARAAAAALAARTIAPLTSVSCDAEGCVKTIYY